MKEKFELLTKTLADPATKTKLLAAAAVHEHFVGKKILGRDFIVTQGGLVGVAAECGETALHNFFDGDDKTFAGKKTSEWMKLYGPFEVKDEAKPADTKK